MDTPTWLSHDFRAMGSDISILLDAPERVAQSGFRAGEEFFRRVEALLTRFKPTSELSYVNAHAGQWVGISPLFLWVLDEALKLARQTGGIFDPTMLPALRQAGYTQDIDTVRKGVDAIDLPAGDPQQGRWSEVRLDTGRSRVLVPEGVQIDLGGIAKGWTAQQAALLLGQWGPCLVDAGGDLAAGAPPPGMPGWPVSVAAPWKGPDGEAPDLVVMWLARASLTTSGIDRRRWRRGDDMAHHLIDPRTGKPAETDLLSASILAVEAAQAEAWATAAVVMGMQPALKDFTERGIASVLVGQDHRIEITPALRPYIAWSAEAETV